MHHQARMQLMRDFGCLSGSVGVPCSASGLETLPVRMRQALRERADPLPGFLESGDKIASVRYPALPSSGEHYERAQKYLPMGTSGRYVHRHQGSRAPGDEVLWTASSWRAMRFTLPTSALACCIRRPKYRQLTDEQLVAPGIEPGMVRISVGLEMLRCYR